MPESSRGLARALPFRVNYYGMLVVLVAFYLFLPLGIEWMVRYTWLLHVSFCLILVSGVLAAETNRRLFTISIVLAGLAFVMGWIPQLHDFVDAAEYHPFRVAQHVVNILFVGFTAFVLLRSIFTSGKISTEGICAAVCVYFLIGIVWAFGYMLLDDLRPGSFSNFESKAAVYEAANQLADQTEGISRARVSEMVDTVIFLYYSLITLTTVGYGDIAPLEPFAMMLSAMEGFMGQIYIAVLVAWLVGVRVSTAMIQRQQITPDE